MSCAFNNSKSHSPRWFCPEFVGIAFARHPPSSSASHDLSELQPNGTSSTFVPCEMKFKQNGRETITWLFVSIEFCQWLLWCQDLRNLSIFSVLWLLTFRGKTKIRTKSNQETESKYKLTLLFHSRVILNSFHYQKCIVWPFEERLRDFFYQLILRCNTGVVFYSSIRKNSWINR